MLHRAAGLTVAADRPLPGFVPQPATSTHAEDLRIHLASRPAWHDSPAMLLHTADAFDAAGHPIVSVSRSAEGFRFIYADGTRAWIDSHGANVWCTWVASSTLADVCTYLYGPILGLVLRLRGSLALHASAVAFGPFAIGFTGPHGAGKSTLAAALGVRGHRVITDDVLHLRRDAREWLAEPFASMLKLWPEGALMAFGTPTDLPRIAEGWNKRALALGDGIPAADGPLPLAALACFAGPAPETSIASLSPAAALLRLAANSSASHLLDSDARAAEFRALSDLVRDVPCVALTPPEDSAAYPAFVQQVLEWGRSLDRHAAP